MLADHDWAVSLEGDAFDLEDARELFGAGTELRVCIIQVPPDRNPTVLMADEFDGLENASEVIEACRRLVDVLNGILFVLDIGRRPLRPWAVHRWKAGTWGPGIIHAGIEIKARARMKARATVLRAPGAAPLPRPLPPPHTRWMKEAAGGDILSDVLTYLRGEPDWFDLYKAFELMRDDINRMLGQHKEPEIGWPETNFFSESAQVHRHSRAKAGRYDLTSAMPLLEAREFLARIARIWLEWRFPPT